MPGLRLAGFCSRLLGFALITVALSAYPLYASSSGGEKGGEKRHSYEEVAAGHGVLHLHLHEHGIPELANAIDYFRAAIARVIVQPRKATFEPAGKPNEFILIDEEINFYDKKVGKKGCNPPEDAIEDMVYSVWITEGPEELKGRYAVVEVSDNELVVEKPAHGGGAKHEAEKKHEGPVEVTYKVKEEHTMTSIVWEGAPAGDKMHYWLSLNWNDCANVIFAFITILLLGALCFLATRKKRKIPKGFQALAEMMVGGLDSFTQGILGDRNKPYLPFVGTLFIYILFMALLGLVPFAKSPVALNYNMPLALALCVFFFVQYHAVKQNGVGGYVKHLMGEPIWLCWMQFPLHIIGEFVKPLSLSLRLFANISAEDILVAALVLMMVFLPWFEPIPLQILFFPLALLFSLIQALVFMSLSAVYIAIMFPHDEEHH